MQWVDISQFDAGTKRTDILVRFVLDADGIRWEGDAALAERLAHDGVFSTSLGRQTFPTDGEAFLYALGEEYRSAYFFAGEPSQGTPPPLR